MWIPHFLLEFWEAETSLESVQASESDNEERTFELWFFLEDLPIRSTRDSCLALDSPQEKVQTDGHSRKASMRFEPNSQGRLSSVAFKVKDRSPKAAFRYCLDTLSRLMSFWAVTAGTGFGIFALRVIDGKHEAKWKVVPQRPAPEPFYMPSGIACSDEHSAVLSLYREGRNSISPFYRLLCFYKILEAWNQHGNVFGAADRLVRDRNLSFRRPRRVISKDMLVQALLFSSHPEFEGKTFTEFFALLNPFRIRVAHAVTDSGDFIDLDKYESVVEFGPIANLADLVSRQVILDEFELWHQIREALGSGEQPRLVSE